jgi:hypothetical protein
MRLHRLPQQHQQPLPLLPLRYVHRSTPVDEPKSTNRNSNSTRFRAANSRNHGCDPAAATANRSAAASSRASNSTTIPPTVTTNPLPRAIHGLR